MGGGSGRGMVRKKQIHFVASMIMIQFLVASILIHLSSVTGDHFYDHDPF
jgi:hypothetical protein